jgi:hypothetical protein
VLVWKGLDQNRAMEEKYPEKPIVYDIIWGGGRLGAILVI